MRLVWLKLGATVASAVSVLAFGGCSTRGDEAARPDRVAETTQAIQGGTTDTKNKFAVGVCGGNAGQCSTICSGALILPNVVATARHCVDDSPETVDCSTDPSFGARKKSPFNITTNTTIGSAASGWFGVKSIHTTNDAHICGNDIALLVLNSSVPSATASPIVPGVQYVMWDPAADYGTTFTAIGYGNTSPAGDGAGTRRIRPNVSLLCVPGSDDMPCPKSIHASEFVAGDGTCSGDSGSSSYESSTLAKGTPVSFGVLSRGGESEDGTECQGSIYTRFDAHRDLVLEVARAASNDWKLYPEPSWTESRPPPVSKNDKKDAGAKKDSGAVVKPVAKDFGVACETGAECASGLCEDAGDETLICTAACSESANCASGYVCRDDLCLPPLPEPAAPATMTRTVKSGCTTTSSSPSSAWGFVLFGTALAAGARRRRKGRARA